MLDNSKSTLLPPGPSSTPIPSLLGPLVWPLDERPVDVDGLAQHVGAVQLLAGCQGLLVGLVLDQGVALKEPCPPVQVEVDVLDLAVLAEPVVDVVLLSLLVDPGHEQDPALDRTLKKNIYS